MNITRAPTKANKTDAGNGSKAICRVSNVLRSPSPDPNRSANRNSPLLEGYSGTMALGAIHRLPLGTSVPRRLVDPLSIVPIFRRLRYGTISSCTRSRRTDHD
jgi:hypothetical protein